MGEDGVVCVEREEERDKLEQEVETQCTQQNVTQVRGRGTLFWTCPTAPKMTKMLKKGSNLNCQCYNDYETVYRDEVKEDGAHEPSIIHTLSRSHTR